MNYIENGAIQIKYSTENNIAYVNLRVWDGKNWREVLIISTENFAPLEIVDSSSLPIPLKILKTVSDRCGTPSQRLFYQSSNYQITKLPNQQSDKHDVLSLLSSEHNGCQSTMILSLRTVVKNFSPVSLPNEQNWLSVETTCNSTTNKKFQSFFSHFLFMPDGKSYEQYKPLKYCWIPTLRKKENHVIPDQIFRSPALILCTDSIAAALVPDIEYLKIHRPFPTCLDAKLIKYGTKKIPDIGFGFQNYNVAGHTYFAADQDKLCTITKNKKIQLKFYLYLAVTTPEKALRDITAFLWNNFGQKEISQSEPQTIPFEQYAKYGTEFAMKNGKIWRELRLSGDITCGGTLATTFSGKYYPKIMNINRTKKYLRLNKLQQYLHKFSVESILLSPVYNDLLELFIQNFRLEIPPLILFQSWFNNMRTAYGLYWFGKQWENEHLIKRAQYIKNLALSAPSQQGVFSAVCCAASDGILWVEGTRAFGFLNEYHLPDNAWTAYWMLRWYEELEQDSALLDKCTAFGNFLLNVQKDDGSIPSWVKISVVRDFSPVNLNKTPVVKDFSPVNLIDHKKQIHPSSLLERSAQTAISALFLVRLAQITKKEKYKNAAELAAKFLVDKIIPNDLWFDFETFFSCSKKSLTMHDCKIPTIPPQNNLCLFWTTEFFKELYILTGKTNFLNVGSNLLDRLCLYQQVWNAPYLSINTFGGFGVMNTDAEWNDARQSMFAESLMDYYILTGRKEYFERGIAALRASFTLMLIPENRTVAPNNFPAKLHTKDIGATYENYAHLGYNRRVPGYIMFDWGSGGAITTAARTLKKFGDFLIDVKRNNGFGINFCSIKNLKIKKENVVEQTSPAGSILSSAGSILQIEPKPIKVQVTNLNPQSEQPSCLSSSIEFELESPVLTKREWKGKFINIPKGKWTIRANNRQIVQFDNATDCREQACLFHV